MGKFVILNGSGKKFVSSFVLVDEICLPQVQLATMDEYPSGGVRENKTEKGKAINMKAGTYNLYTLLQWQLRSMSHDEFDGRHRELWEWGWNVAHRIGNSLVVCCCSCVCFIVFVFCFFVLFFLFVVYASFFICRGSILFFYNDISLWDRTNLVVIRLDPN